METAYWNPSVVTGPDGKALVRFPAPSALSRYQFTARGAAGADTLVGQTTAEIRVKKDVFVDLKHPAVLAQGDRPRFLARLHHVGATGPARVALKISAGGREQVFPKTLDIKNDGVDEVAFEPFEVPDGDMVRLTLTAQLGDAADEMVSEVPIRPWGVPAIASASGSFSSDATAIVTLPPGRAYESPEMQIVLAPTVRRMLVELALGSAMRPLSRLVLDGGILPPDTVTDRASDLIAATAALSYLRTTRATDAPEASRLTDRVRGLAAELVTLQNEDGGWPWVAGTGQDKRPSERLASARAFWALAATEPLGLLADPAVLDRGANYLTQAFAQAEASDHETRAVLCCTR